MKLKQLIVELEKLEKLNPDAEAHFQWVEDIGNGTMTSEASFVEASVLHGQVTIRITDPVYIEAVRRYNRE
jgi:hypothetical protein